MAVTRTGSVTKITSSANSGSQAVTVPADAQLAIVAPGGVPNAAVNNYFSGTPPTIAGAATTLRRDDDANGNLLCQCIFTYTSPPTGSQTFAWDWSGTNTLSLGAFIWVAFYTGVDTTTPIGATGGSQDADSSATTGSLALTSGDAIFGIGTGYNPTSLTWTGGTEIDDSQFNGLTGGSAEAFPGSATTFTVTQSGGTPQGTTISAIVIKQAAAAGRTTKNTDISPLGIRPGISRRITQPVLHASRKFFIPKDMGKIIVPGREAIHELNALR